ncbi:MAG: hypothetical protein MUP22_00355 [Desulfobacterales bacterium]|nr:hypothetical protein [Desulfobacterales bacterium]
MKQYTIDELRQKDYEKLKAYLKENYGSSSVGDIFWIPITKKILTPVQAEHIECQPFYFSMDLEPNFLACELLVRTKSNVRCNCMAYATQGQRNWLISLIDSIFTQLNIIT